LRAYFINEPSQLSERFLVGQSLDLVFLEGVGQRLVVTGLQIGEAAGWIVRAEVRLAVARHPDVDEFDWEPVVLQVLRKAEADTHAVDAYRVKAAPILVEQVEHVAAGIVTTPGKYGPLVLCEYHGIAAYHKPLLLSRSPLGPAPIYPIDKPFEYNWCGPRPERDGHDAFSERVEVWFKLARRATSLLRVASAVRTQGNASEELWEQADGFRGSLKERFGPFWAYLDNPRNRLAANLDCWIVTGDVCLRVQAEDRSLVAALGGNPFTFCPIALVVMQLVLTVLRAEGLASCAGCATPFVSSRPPLAGKLVGPQVAERNYCTSCRAAKIPRRDAARDYRQRERTKSTLH